MKRPVLLLIDLQNDYLAAEGLTPPRGELVRRAERLLVGCRREDVPVVHVWTTVSRDPDDRMPHHRRAERWVCVAGTEGHATPEALRPGPAETVAQKRFFSGFSSPDLDAALAALDADGLILAGIHLQGCVRATALDAYERDLEVWVAEDAVGTHEPLHAALSRDYLGARVARVADTETILSSVALGGSLSGSGPGAWIERPSPGRPGELAWRLPVSSSEEVRVVAATANAAATQWRAVPLERRKGVLERAADLLAQMDEELAGRLVEEIGKPLRYAQAEVARAVALVRAAARRDDAAASSNGEAEVRRPPLGTVAQVTPWNNPVAIPLGKLAPALRYGNAVVWKPAPAGSAIALTLASLITEAGAPAELVGVVLGDAATAQQLMRSDAIDAVSLTGSEAAGYAATGICAERRLPLQAELGGNNAAIVWDDCDLPAAAAAIAEGAFGMAGQRCTANRRAIVAASCHDDFVSELTSAVGALRLGDPSDPGVSIGPLVSEAARERVAATLDRARASGEVRPLATEAGHAPPAGAYLPPSLVLCSDPAAEIAREETFGPVLVVQPATSFDAALELLNGVRQGLVAALFSSSPEHRSRFIADARAGILKLDRSTADAGIEAPFGGWKASGVGPPEHGEANRDFYTRTQAIYA